LPIRFKFLQIGTSASICDTRFALRQGRVSKRWRT
jgi:hypothetical protein